MYPETGVGLPDSEEEAQQDDAVQNEKNMTEIHKVMDEIRRMPDTTEDRLLERLNIGMMPPVPLVPNRLFADEAERSANLAAALHRSLAEKHKQDYKELVDYEKNDYPKELARMYYNIKGQRMMMDVHEHTERQRWPHKMKIEDVKLY